MCESHRCAKQRERVRILRRRAAAPGTYCQFFPFSLLSSGIVGSHELGLRSVSPHHKSRWRCCAYRGPRGSAACCCQRHGAELLLNGKALAPDCRQGKQKQKWCVWWEPAVLQPQCARCCRGSCAWDSSPLLISSVYFSFFLPLLFLLYFFFPLSLYLFTLFPLLFLLLSLFLLLIS